MEIIISPYNYISCVGELLLATGIKALNISVSLAVTSDTVLTSVATEHHNVPCLDAGIE